MATRHLTRWRTQTHLANRAHGNYLEVHLFGTETRGFFQQYRVSEAFKIPLTDAEIPPLSDMKVMKQYVKRAMELSANKWTGPIP
jgi:hypothetical protein